MAKKKNIDPDQVESLGAIGCTNEEIACLLGVSADTIERRFAGAIKRGKLKDFVSFKRRVREEAIGSAAKPDKANVGFAVLYAKIRGWYIEKVERVDQVNIVNDDSKLKELIEAKACKELSTKS